MELGPDRVGHDFARFLDASMMSRSRTGVTFSRAAPRRAEPRRATASCRALSPPNSLRQFRPARQPAFHEPHELVARVFTREPERAEAVAQRGSM